jgi:mRNA-degrading endonuclease toxin of MazEF toxin-antitoxin module
MRKLWLLSALLVSILVFGQKQKIGDFIESKSYNLDKIGVKRQQQYFPEGGAFVCTNGTNRYTRALYGGHTDWRLETSDRPVFAVVKKGHHRNIRFEMDYGGRTYALDQLDCKALYGGSIPGARYYGVTHPQWADTLGIVVMAHHDREGALFTFLAPWMGDSARVKAIVCPILKDATEGPLHIPLRECPVEGVVLCEQVRYVDLSARRFSKLAESRYFDIMDISDAVMAMFDYQEL